MVNQLVVNDQAAAFELALVGNDLSRLKAEDRLVYYKKLCDSVGLSPYSQPFAYLELNKRLTLYAKKDATDQLRKLHGVNLRITDTKSVDGLYIVKVAAKDKHGREDEDLGAVPIIGLRGEHLANAMLKATTKAKRRVTLSICGLGFLDETEAEATEGATFVDGPYPTAATNHQAIPSSITSEPPTSMPGHPVEELGDAGDWPIWVADVEEQIAACDTVGELRDNWSAWTANLVLLKTARPDLHEKLVACKDERKAIVTNILNGA